MDHLELNPFANPGIFVGAVQFVRLIDRNLRVLISVNEQQGRIFPIDMKHGAGKPGQLGNVFRL